MRQGGEESLPRCTTSCVTAGIYTIHTETTCASWTWRWRGRPARQTTAPTCRCKRGDMGSRQGEGAATAGKQVRKRCRSVATVQRRAQGAQWRRPPEQRQPLTCPGGAPAPARACTARPPGGWPARRPSPCPPGPAAPRAPAREPDHSRPCRRRACEAGERAGGFSIP